MSNTGMSWMEKISDKISEDTVEFEKSIKGEQNESNRGLRYNSGKPRLGLLPWLPLVEIAKVLTFGAKKYTAHNWRAGLKYEDTMSSMLRHLAAWSEGEENDEESGISHLAHAGCNLLFLLNFHLTKTGFDDRYRGETKRQIKNTN